MSKVGSQFVFMTCRAGAEAAVKDEVARVEPAWHLSFSRPGFLTFKNTLERPLDARQLAERNWTFAHAHGISLGRLTGERLEDLAGELWRLESVARLATHGEFGDVHVWQREFSSTGDSVEQVFDTPLCHEIETAVRAAAPESLDKLRQVRTGRRRATPRNAGVLDVIVLEPGLWWIGHHRAMRRHERWPGGAIPVQMPEHAVSRAYAKMEEAVQWSGLPLAAGDECVEIGCAPGGASQALLDRGLFVTGIDPANVDPVVVSHPRFRHLKKRGTDVRRKEFEGVRWLAADMNIAPEATLDEVEAIVTHPDVAIRGMVLTLKFSDWNAARRLPELAARVRAWGYREVRTRQLVTGGQEVCLVALRRKELRRLGRKLNRRSAMSSTLRLRPEGSSRPNGKRHRQPRQKPRVDASHPNVPGPHF
ncbi:MAG: SAM-dependent methyltransferase [Pirellulales bacterium]